MRHFRLCALAAAVFAALAMYAPRAGAGHRHERYVVAERAVDGDTIKLRGGERVRYLGMDSPEKGEPFYEEAKKRNSELVKGKKLKILVCAEEPLDKYGRTLAWVYSSDSLINAAILREGLAKLMVVPPCGIEKEEELRRIEKDAQARHVGIWGLERAGLNGDGRAIPARDALKHVGEAVSIKGRVKDVYKAEKIIFINFGNRKNAFTAVIFKSSFAAFASAGLDPMDLKGRVVVVKGVVRKYGDRAEIVVKLPTQIDVD